MPLNNSRRLNGGPEKNIFVTDPTNAPRSMFMNLHTLKYDEQLLDLFRFDMKKLHLPKIVRSSDAEAYGTLTTGVLSGVPVTWCLGDQSAALVGQKGFSPGRAKNTYGTGCFLLYHVGGKSVISTHGLLSTVAYDFDGTPQYALEGSIAVAGSSIKFLQNNFGFIGASNQISPLAETVEDNGGVVFVTAFSGLFAPYWIDDARGTLCKIFPCALFVFAANDSQSGSTPTRRRVTWRAQRSKRLASRRRLFSTLGEGQRIQARRIGCRWWNDELGLVHAGIFPPPRLAYIKH